MRSCESIDPLVTPYIDRELPDEDRQAIDHHLRSCPPCYSRVLAEQAVRDLVHARQPELNKKEAPRSLHARCAALTIGLTADRDRDGVVKPAVRGQVVPLPLPANAGDLLMVAPGMRFELRNLGEEPLVVSEQRIALETALLL